MCLEITVELSACEDVAVQWITLHVKSLVQREALACYKHSSSTSGSECFRESESTARGKGRVRRQCLAESVRQQGWLGRLGLAGLPQGEDCGSRSRERQEGEAAICLERPWMGARHPGGRQSSPSICRPAIQSVFFKKNSGMPQCRGFGFRCLELQGSGFMLVFLRVLERPIKNSPSPSRSTCTETPV